DFEARLSIKALVQDAGGRRGVFLCRLRLRDLRSFFGGGATGLPDWDSSLGD
ncbi:hypothetical protein TorRG33x02_314600, partial [Trema orientale]